MLMSFPLFRSKDRRVIWWLSKLVVLVGLYIHSSQGQLSQSCELYSPSNSSGTYRWVLIDFQFICDGFISRSRDISSFCDICTVNFHCGFCATTLQCLAGDASGPNNSLPCPQWLFETSACPGMMINVLLEILVHSLFFSCSWLCTIYNLCHVCFRRTLCVVRLWSTMSRSFSSVLLSLPRSGLRSPLPCRLCPGYLFVSVFVFVFCLLVDFR